jgi:hypothetical protein
MNIRSGFPLYTPVSDSSGILILRDEIELMSKLTELTELLKTRIQETVLGYLRKRPGPSE